MNKLPNFLCVGAQKAGTTTLHDILKQHPDIFLPKIKETKFFHRNHLYNKGIGYYLKKFFTEYKHEKIIGEIDPEYMYFDYIPKRIAENLGNDIKLLFILRNPVDRAYSHYLMSHKRGYDLLSFDEAILLEKDRINDINNDTKDYSQKNHLSYIDRGFYSIQINRYLQYFDKKNMHFIIFEEFMQNKKKHINELLSFLDVDNITIDIDIKSNQAQTVRFINMSRFINKPNKMKEKILKKIFPLNFLRFIKNIVNKINIQDVKPSKLSIEDKRKIYKKYYKDEVDSLERLLNKDLSLWKYK